jgi:hypothetical protein
MLLCGECKDKFKKNKGDLLLKEMCEDCKQRILTDITAVNQCRHERVFSPTILTSNPPQQRWICKHCGLEGTEVLGAVVNISNAYDDLKKKFAGN